MGPRHLLLFVFLGLKITWAAGQSDFRGELSLTIDNDAFLIAGIDRYYSSGLFATLKNKARAPSKMLRRFYRRDSLAREHFQYQLAHVFYTAYNPRWADPDKFDRPYAGWIYLQSGWQATGSKSSLQLTAGLGMVGPATLIQPLQYWWHDIFGYRKPRGWDYQINNSPSVHVSASYTRRLVYHPSAEIYFESSQRAGTILTQSVNGLALRLGKLKPFVSSLWGGNRIWEKSGRRGIDEFFVFIKERARYRFYDATVQGNFIGKPSLHTEELQPLLFHHFMGIAMAWPGFDLVLGHNVTSKETPEARFHQYTTFDFYFRF